MGCWEGYSLDIYKKAVAFIRIARNRLIKASYSEDVNVEQHYAPIVYEYVTESVQTLIM